jgi:hypothetical protein
MSYNRAIELFGKSRITNPPLLTNPTHTGVDRTRYINHELAQYSLFTTIYLSNIIEIFNPQLSNIFNR